MILLNLQFLCLLLGIDFGELAKLIMPILSAVLPGIVTTFAVGLVKKYLPTIPKKWITTLVMPLLAFLLSIVASLTLDANIWTGFLLGLVSTFFYQLKKAIEEWKNEGNLPAGVPK